MTIFKRRTVLDLIDNQIAEGMKAHISNQGTAEHYQALANGNVTTLIRLRLQRAAEVEATAVKPVKVHRPAPPVSRFSGGETVTTTTPAKPAKLRSAS